MGMRRKLPVKKIKKASSPRIFRIVSVFFLAVSIIVFLVLSVFVQYQDLRETYALAEKTVAFLKTECQKFENYVQGNSASAKQDLLDTAIGLLNFIPDSELTDESFLQIFIRTEHISGVLMLDQDLSVIAQADMDNQDSFSLWKETLEKENIREMFAYPQKQYVDGVTIGGVLYDFAVIASEDGERLIFCYSSTVKPDTDPYELNISGVLTNNSFYKDPSVVIAEGDQILSTNNPALQKIGEDEFRKLNESIKWREKQLTRFKYDGATWYGLRRVYNKYVVYTVYTEGEVFSNRSNFIARAFMIYLMLCLIILFIQLYLNKANLKNVQKQLRIINAISTSYASTFLMHLDRMELEAVKLSDLLQKKFEKAPALENFLDSVCQKEIAPEYQETLRRFLDTENMAERLKGYPYLEQEIRNQKGDWYSFLLIPQRYDAEHKIQAVLVATRDVTAIKQAEELSFKDKLTGLYNRNYMEAQSGKFFTEENCPVSLIMADCNYLKRTNDTLGHEYGDFLLKRVAEIITGEIPENAVAMRVGGDEFLILCPQVSYEKAEALITTIRRKLAEKSEAGLPLSVSFGVYTAENREVSFKEAYDQADQAMYQDKQRSRAGRE